MIQSKEDLKYYISSDLKSLGVYPLSLKIRGGAMVAPSIWRFQVKLRKCEYAKNCKQHTIFGKALFKIKFIRYQRYGLKLGFSIPLNVFGPGLCLCHAGTIIVNGCAKVGANARIHAGVNIGSFSRFDKNWKQDNAPVIGDNVYVGPGAKLFGKIVIGNNVAIGANAVVNKNIRDHVTVVGVPAVIINEKGSENMMIYGDESVMS